MLREITITWCIEDVQEERPDLTDEQASEVLRLVERKHDANIGINWDFIRYMADHLYPQPHDPNQQADEDQYQEER